MSSSAPPEVPVETGSHSDFKVWDINSMAEPIMRVWQLSEALSRMAKRIQKRYPDEAKILRTSSEDIIHHFFLDMRERQSEFVENAKTNETNSLKEQDEKQRKARQEKLSPIEVEPEAAPATTTPVTVTEPQGATGPEVRRAHSPERLDDDLTSYSGTDSGNSR